MLDLIMNNVRLEVSWVCFLVAHQNTPSPVLFYLKKALR